MTRSAGLLCALALVSACAADGKTRAAKRGRAFDVQQPFPSEKRLEQIAASQPGSDPLVGFGDPPATVDRWTLTAELPTAVGHAKFSGTDPLRRRIADRIDAAGSTATDGMMCFAQEYAHFLATHSDVPPVDIQQFMIGRCGAAVALPSLRSVRFDKAVTPERALADAPASKQMVDGIPAGSLAGIGWAQGEKDLVFVIATGKPDVRLDPIPFSLPTSAAVVIRGEVAWPFEWLTAHFTRGALDFGRCTPLPGGNGRENEFALQCPVDGRDPLAVIEVMAAPRGELIGHPILTFAISPDGSQPLEYVAPTYSLPVDPNDRRPEGVVAAINALRSEQKQKPLRLAPEQSTIVQNLFAHLQGQTDPSVRNEVALGIIAGWQVEGTIREGQFEVRVGNREWSLERLMGGSLASPSFRSVVLDASADIVAVGTLEGESSRATGMLYATYDLFEPRSFAEEEAMFFAELDRQRASVGLEPALRVQGPKDTAVLQASAERIRKNESTPGEELDVLLQDFVNATGRPFQGIAFAPMHIEGWRPDFPKELFEFDHVAAAVTVSYFEPPGAAWGQHVVLMVFTKLDGPMKA